MAIKALPHKWTCLVGIFLLAALIWSKTFDDGYSDLLVFFLLACFLLSALISLILLVADRSKAALYHVLINLVIVLLLFPAIRLGGFFEDRLFLMNLPKFQQITDVLIREEQAKAHPDAFTSIVTLPPGNTNLRVLDRVRIDVTKGSVTVRYLVRNSSALSHRGYIYRSDDNPTALENEFPHTGYTHLAPHWFY
ncbi:MAG: hypothetical protein WA894_02615, partial [Candidatus Acidiferrum sp.]